MSDDEVEADEVGEEAQLLDLESFSDEALVVDKDPSERPSTVSGIIFVKPRADPYLPVLESANAHHKSVKMRRPPPNAQTSNNSALSRRKKYQVPTELKPDNTKCTPEILSNWIHGILQQKGVHFKRPCTLNQRNQNEKEFYDLHKSLQGMAELNEKIVDAVEHFDTIYGIQITEIWARDITEWPVSTNTRSLSYMVNHLKLLLEQLNIIWKRLVTHIKWSIDYNPPPWFSNAFTPLAQRYAYLCVYPMKDFIIELHSRHRKFVCQWLTDPEQSHLPFIDSNGNWFPEGEANFKKRLVPFIQKQKRAYQSFLSTTQVDWNNVQTLMTKLREYMVPSKLYDLIDEIEACRYEINPHGKYKYGIYKDKLESKYFKFCKDHGFIGSAAPSSSRSSTASKSRTRLLPIPYTDKSAPAPAPSTAKTLRPAPRRQAAT